MRAGLAIAVIMALMLSACEESPKAAFARTCTEIMGVVIETMFKSESAPLSARPAADEAAAQLCDCRVNSIAALEDVSDADKEAYYRDGVEAEGISRRSRPLLKAEQDRCGEAFATALVAAIDGEKQDD